jgi:hypothetical protein
MPRTDKFYKKRRDSFRRPIGQRGYPKDRILIVCEGAKTEPNYFKGFRISSVRVTVIGAGDNTIRIVNKAINERDEARKNHEPFKRVWCVFDRDSFPVEHFNNALDLAEREGITVAYSNEAFELWYLLHFCYMDSALARQQYISKLEAFLGHKYEKNNETMYDELEQKKVDAIRNADKLLNGYQQRDPAHDNPSTTVHLLVKELEKYS